MINSQGSTSLRSPLAQPAIEAIWVAAASAIGWQVQREASAYATTNGKGTISIGVDDILDSDDAVAQLVFHELCHGLVEGPQKWGAPDWGLSNSDDRDVAREHACLRVQVHLAEPHGLRELMAPTTEYRRYHDDIAGDPLVHASDVAAALARQALARPESRAWCDVLERALRETREAIDAVAISASTPAAAVVDAIHPVGFSVAQHQESCGTCAWRYRGGRGRPVDRCRQSAPPDRDGRRTAEHFRACVRWEPAVDCLTCGACCREAYHSVTVSVRDPVVWKQPDLIVRNGHRFEIRRSGERCAALTEVDNASAPPRAIGEGTSSPHASRAFSCAIYDDRPRTCRDFEAGGRHCLVARRRVGLSP